VCSEGSCGGEGVVIGCMVDDECEKRNIYFCIVVICDVLVCVCVIDFIFLNGSVCDDGDVCIEVGVCFDGVCAFMFVNCNDDNLCTIDICNDMGCINIFNTNFCDDGINCIVDDICIDGGCVG